MDSFDTSVLTPCGKGSIAVLSLRVDSVLPRKSPVCACGLRYRDA
jgi:hypothetical protein